MKEQKKEEYDDFITIRIFTEYNFYRFRYDLQLREDNNVNRMHEALRLFSLLGSNSYFKHTPIILLLNKTDLFRQKLEHRSLSVCFPEYTGMKMKRGEERRGEERWVVEGEVEESRIESRRGKKIRRGKEKY